MDRQKQIDILELFIKLQKDRQKQIDILQLFIRLQKVDKQALEHLKKLVEMAEKNPAKYNLALKFL